MLPRNTYSGTSITTASLELGDPAVVAMQNIGNETREVETSDAALARIVATLARILPDWHRDPARGCVGMPAEAFISKQPKTRAAAFTACGRCPAEIRQACLDWAVEVDDRNAILGGRDPAARRRLVADRVAEAS